MKIAPLVQQISLIKGFVLRRRYPVSQLSLVVEEAHKATKAQLDARKDHPTTFSAIEALLTGAEYDPPEEGGTAA